jgi:WD40 repeat protein
MPLAADKFDSVALKASPSLLYNNLSNDGTFIAYVHSSDVHILRENVCSGAAPTFLPKISVKEVIMQAKFCVVGANSYLVLGTIGDIQIWDPEEAKKLFTLSLPPADLAESKQMAFARGVAACDDFICVGTSVGKVLPIKAEGNKFQPTALFDAHPNPLCELCADGKNLVTADHEGSIAVWAAPNWDECWRIAATGFGCSTVQMRGDTIIAGFLSGHIRLYDCTNKAIRAEICAHTRAINSIALHPTLCQFASASEDTHVTVWNFTADFDVEVVMSSSVPDQLLSGVIMTESSLATVAYDVDSMRIWK